MSEKSKWPQGKTCAVVVTVNFDAESVDLHEAKPDNLYGKYSYGRYGMRAGVPEPQPLRGCTISMK